MANDSLIVDVQIVGVNELNAAFSKSPEIVGGNIRTAISKAMISLVASARQYVVRDTSRLADAIRSSQQGDFSGKITAETQYAIYVHEGTRPHFPPLESVRPWADRHGIPAFVVARAIAARGTKANPFFNLAQKNTQAEVDVIFKTALNNIIKQLVK